MYPVRKTAAWLVLPLAAAGTSAAAQVQYQAQPVAPAPYVGRAPGTTAQSELSRHLNMLARNPNSVEALVGAGKAALELEDPAAALTFFGRAEELSPQDGMIKAGLGSALALMEQPETALQFFYEAVRLGVPAAEFAGYRGLAYDLTGDTPHAQQDYQLALRRRDDPEVRRRLALSLAISGQRDAALAAIDSQLRRQDRAAWRVRAFVLALTGDARGANQVVESMMPGQAANMAPFLARLPSLSPADRAHAVHFGHFPGEASAASASAAIASAQAAPAPRSDPVTAAGRPDPTQRPFGEAVAAAQRAPIALAPPPPAPALPPAPVVTVMPPSPTLAPGFSVQAPAPVLPPAAAPTVNLPVTASVPPPVVAPLPPTPKVSGLADLATVIARLSDPVSPAKAAPAKPTPASPKKAEKPVPKNPSRDWVQLAGSRNESGFSGEYRRIKAKAPKLFTGKSAWTASEGNRNRLLVGPFESNKEAQDFVNRLKKEHVSAFSWTSESGQEIEKLPAK